MNTHDMKNYLKTLRNQMNQMDSWIFQTSELIYQLEERILDIEDERINNDFSDIPLFKNMCPNVILKY